MLPSGPYTLELDQEVDLVSPSASTRFVKILLANNSPFYCQVDLGQAADWLQPWMMQLYILPAGCEPSITPMVSLTTPNAMGTLTANWYLPEDTISGTYPAPLGYPDATTERWPSTPGFISLPATGGTGLLVPAPPIGYVNSLDVITQSSTVTGGTVPSQIVTLTGATSGKTWLTYNALASSASPFPPSLIDISVTEEIDATMASFGAGAGGNVRITVAYRQLPSA